MKRGMTRRGTLLVLVAAAGLLVAAPTLLRRARDPQPAAGLGIHARPRELPDLHFVDGAGTPTSLAAFRGKVVLLNVWATWCSSCRAEMPTLDRLQAMLGGKDFEVVALSIDKGGVPAVRQFFAEVGVKHLQPYVDTTGGAASSLGAVGIPLTLLIDGSGREVGRKLGPAAWDAPQTVQLIRAYLAPAATPAERTQS